MDSDSNKPIFLLLLGVEGSGHHMLSAFLKPFFEQQQVAVHGSWHPYLFNRWDALKPESITELALSKQELRDKLEQTMHSFQTAPKESARLLYCDVSFPFGRQRDSLRRPDLVDMFELLQPYVRFRPLVIYRDPISCTFSALRRGFNNNALHQARIVEDNLLYINSALQAAEMDYRTVSFERFTQDLRGYAAGFQHWWQVSPQAYAQGAQALRAATAKDEIPESILTELDDFFTPLRCRQWLPFLQQRDLCKVV